MSVKVLIVDDSPVIREKISTMLSEDSEIQVLGIADGKDNAMGKIAALKPDVITLNLKSRQDSTAFLKAVSTQSPLPVVVITEAPIESLGIVKSGTVDFVKMPLIRTANTMEEFTYRLARHIKVAAKNSVKTAAPTAQMSNSGFSAKLREEPAIRETTAEVSAKPKTTLTQTQTFEPLSKVQPKFVPDRPARPERETDIRIRPESARTEALAETARSDEAMSPTAKALAAAAAARQMLVNPGTVPKGRRHVIALGASTGGTDALHTVLQDLPVSTPGIVIVQHMPEMFTKMYADRLDRSCKMSCVEAVDGERVETGKIILAAGSFHLRLAKDSKGYYVTSQHGEKVSGHCPSVDVLFESVAKVAGKDAIGAIFTGMGADGAAGLKKMRDAGAFTIGQDQKTCVVYGMPMVAYNMGAVCLQAPLEKIPQIILENC